MSDSPIEQRKKPRYPASFLLYFAGNETVGYAYTRNISDGGCFVETEDPVEEGLQFGIEIFMDFGVRAVPMRGEARVMWSNRNAQNAKLGMGLKFGDMDDDSRDCLEKALAFVSSFQQPLPDRAL